MDGADIVMLESSQWAVDQVCRDGEGMGFGNSRRHELRDRIRMDEDLGQES